MVVNAIKEGCHQAVFEFYKHFLFIEFVYHNFWEFIKFLYFLEFIEFGSENNNGNIYNKNGKIENKKENVEIKVNKNKVNKKEKFKTTDDSLVNLNTWSPDPCRIEARN